MNLERDYALELQTLFRICSKFPNHPF